MRISFTPRRGAVLICDFGPERWAAPRPTTLGPIGVRPEIPKQRRCIIVSPEGQNARGRDGLGLCVAVPLSATPAAEGDPTAVLIPAGRYRSITVDVWAKCSMLASVSHARLTRPNIRGHYVSEWFAASDMERIDAALRASLGL
ncbi:type II toxin-antitoxin system PemK/MazF family toxin [Lichenihabitans sp. Uapishka_5]|uniref:type II toxin-antitoxin system PemK/MazF family toxin n=1 Tax=Lichenihabitans sp. Uapishka_5 TaxID=3037302 RepID=UPI003FA5B31D